MTVQIDIAPVEY